MLAHGSGFETHCVLDGRGSASDYAEQLLIALGASVRRTFQHPDLPPDLAWARSGAMALTGHRDGAPQPCPAPLASCVEGVRAALLSLAGKDIDLPDARTLGERAALSGLTRNGAIAPGGACHLLRAADSWLAVNLPRPDDWALTAAWLETGGTPLQPDHWHDLARLLATHPVARLCERGALLGLAVAPLQPGDHTHAAIPTPPWFRLVTRGAQRPENRMA